MPETLKELTLGPGLVEAFRKLREEEKKGKRHLVILREKVRAMEERKKSKKKLILKRMEALRKGKPPIKKGKKVEKIKPQVQTLRKFEKKKLDLTLI
jgi:hypothetical protein